MQTISVSYALKWEIKNHPNYKVSACGKVFNCQTGKMLKRTVNGGSIGYWISSKFFTLKQLRLRLQKIENYPF